jgi:electron transfer flavoprotein alpha subunit
MHILALTVGSGADQDRPLTKLLDTIRSFARPSDLVTELVAPNGTDAPSIARLADAVEQAAPDLVVLLASDDGDAIAPIVGGRLGWGVITDCVRVALDGDVVRATRSLNRGALEVSLTASTPRSILTVKMHTTADGGTAQAAKGSGTAVDSRQTLAPADPAPPTWIGLSRHDENAILPIVEADIVVGIGRGVTTDEQMNSVRRLANILEASIAASRQAIENGRAAASLKIGDTGLKLGAALYVAVGVSGANQHMSGIDSCLSLVAVNRDPRAAIFGAASAGVVGDMGVLIPELCDALEARLT